MLKLLEAQCLLRAALDFQSFAVVDCSIQSCLVLGDYRYIVIKYVVSAVQHRCCECLQVRLDCVMLL